VSGSFISLEEETWLRIMTSF